MPDIDIDFPDREKALSLIKHVVASRIENDKLVKHNTGVYLHAVPIDARKNLSSIPYEEAENCNFFKVDFLNVSMYKGIKNQEHLEQLMNQEPLWDLLTDDGFSSLLFHVNGHGNILRTMKPESIEQLAAVLAIIRPAKRHLLGKDWDTVLSQVWEKPDTGEYYFKKSHATAYAVAIVVQMNLICEQISYGYA